MEDTGLYQYLLGLKSPWSVSRVGLDVERQRVDVWAEHEGDAEWVCPVQSIRENEKGDSTGKGGK